MFLTISYLFDLLIDIIIISVVLARIAVYTFDI